MQPRQLDDVDVRLLAQLQQDARTSYTQLARRVGVSRIECRARLAALERRGVIRGYTAVLDPRALNLMSFLVRVTLDRQDADRFETFERAVLERPEILECDLITGTSDFQLRVVLPDVAAFEAFQREVLSTVGSVATANSSVALKVVKHAADAAITKLARRT